jgi:DNA-binding transcriptional LysR family regulator
VQDALPHLSTDQVAAFVEVSRHGQIRAAAQLLSITEQGLRNRLLALEAQLGVELYRKVRGPRRMTVLTYAGRRFLPHALAFLERAHELCRAFEIDTGQQEIRVAASQYLIRYVLIDVLKRFAKEEPAIHVRVSTMNEQEVQATLLTDPELALGLAAPYEPSPDLEYHELFAMNWSLIVPPGYQIGAHLAGAKQPRARSTPQGFRGKGDASRPVKLKDLTSEPLILYERGSTGRQHVLDAFHQQGLSPRVALETTSTETIVSMVEGGRDFDRAAPAERRRDRRPPRGRACARRPDPSDSLRRLNLVRRREKHTAAAARLLDFTRSLFQPH